MYVGTSLGYSAKPGRGRPVPEFEGTAELGCAINLKAKNRVVFSDLWFISAITQHSLKGYSKQTSVKQ